MNRSSLGWGLALLLLGALMLADAAGIRLPGDIRPLSFFWPAVLIVLGGWMILGVVLRGKVHSEQDSIELQGASQAALRISHGAGELRIRGGAAVDQLASGTFSGGLEHSSRKEGDRLDVRMSPPSQPFVIFPRFDRYDWDMQLNSEIPMALNLQMGADQSSIDLSSLKLTSLKVETGASQTDVTLPARGRLRADFSLGAASLTVKVPEGVAARVRVSQGVSDVKVDQARFPRMGDFFQSANFDSAENAVEIKIEAGAAEVRIQ